MDTLLVNEQMQLHSDNLKNLLVLILLSLHIFTAVFLDYSKTGKCIVGVSIWLPNPSQAESGHKPPMDRYVWVFQSNLTEINLRLTFPFEMPSVCACAHNTSFFLLEALKEDLDFKGIAFPLLNSNRIWYYIGQDLWNFDYPTRENTFM